MKRRRGQTPVLWVLGVLLLGATQVDAQKPRAGEPEPTTYQRLRTGVAHLGQAGFNGQQGAIQWLGTAFLVDDRCTLATAKHAIEGIPVDQLIVRFVGADSRSYTFPARVHSTTEVDLAFLKFGPETDQKRFCSNQPAHAFPIREFEERSRLTGRSVWVLGYPALEGAPARDVPIVRRGVIASAELDWRGAPMLLLDLTGMPGFSGGPVILEDSGEAIGVVYGPGRTERVFDIEWATPLTVHDYDEAMRRKR